MDGDESAYIDVLRDKRKFVEDSARTDRAATALEVMTGEKSNKDLASTLDRILTDQASLLETFERRAPEVQNIRAEIESLIYPESPAQELEDEEMFFDLITQACSNRALLQRLIERMPSLSLPSELKEHDRKVTLLLESIPPLTERLDQFCAEFKYDHGRVLQWHKMAPAYTRLKEQHDAWKQENEEAKANVGRLQVDLTEAEAKREEAETKQRQAETERDEAEAKLVETESKQRKAETKQSEAALEQRKAETKLVEAESKQKKAESEKRQAESHAKASEEAAREASDKLAQAITRAENAEEATAKTRKQASTSDLLAQQITDEAYLANRRADTAEKRVAELETRLQAAEASAKRNESRRLHALEQVEQLQRRAVDVQHLHETELNLLKPDDSVPRMNTLAAVTQNRLLHTNFILEVRALNARLDCRNLQEKVQSVEAKAAKDLNAIQAEFKQLQLANTSAQEENSRLKGEMLTLQRQNTELERARFGLERDNNALQTEIRAIGSRLAVQEQDNEALREQSEEDNHGVARLQAELHESKSDLAAVQRSRVTMMHRVTKLEGSISDLKLKKRRLQNRYTSLSEDSTALQATNGVLVDRVDSLASRNDRLTELLTTAYNCVKRMRPQKDNLRSELRRHRGAVEQYQEMSTAAEFKEQKAVLCIESWQKMFQSLLGITVADWKPFERVRAISKDMLDFEYSLSCDEWFENTSCLVIENLTVDILYMLRCFARNSLSFDEVQAMARSMIDCDASTRNVILSAMLAHLERETDELSVADAIALLTLQDLVHRYLLDTDLGRRMSIKLVVDHAASKSPLVAGLAEWTCKGWSLAETVSDAAARKGLRIKKENIQLIADGERLLKINEEHKMSILWPGQFELLVDGSCLKLEIGEDIHLSWDLANTSTEHIEFLNRLSDTPEGAVLKSF
jgi:hypothetical protein